MSEQTTSADGTTIGYSTVGDGPPVVVVGGATNLQEHWFDLAAALGDAGFTGVSYDRRGRGASRDTRPYAVEREIEDLAAVIDAVGGGPAGVHGVSSGGALVYRSVVAGLPVRTVSALETPYRVDGAPTPPADYVEHLTDLDDRDAREEMLEYFLTAGVGIPPEAVAGMKGDQTWSALVAIGQTVLYDAHCLGSSLAPVPTDLLAQVGVPVLSVASTGSAPFLVDAARAAADAVPDGRFVHLEGEFHQVPTAVLAPALAEHHGGRR